MAAFWSVVFFLGFGCRFLHGLIVRSATLREPLGGIRIPVVGVDLSAEAVVTAVEPTDRLITLRREDGSMFTVKAGTSLGMLDL